MGVEDAVTFHQIKDILDLLLLAIDGLGSCGADFMAGETLPALADVKGDEAVYQRQRPGPADLQAVTAFLGCKAALRVEGMLGTEALGFRIAAPAASQRTALHKNHIADPLAVIHTEFLDIEDEAFSLFVAHHVVPPVV